MPPMLHAIAFMAGHFAVHQLARLPDPAVWAACALAAVIARGITVWAETGHSRSIIRRASAMVALVAWLLIGVCAAGWRAQMAPVSSMRIHSVLVPPPSTPIRKFIGER